jgi:hypothetical protein
MEQHLEERMIEQDEPMNRALNALADAGLVMGDGEWWALTHNGIRLMRKVEALRARSEPDALKAVSLLGLLDHEGLELTLDDGDSVLAGFIGWTVERAKAALNDAAALGLIQAREIVASG